MAVRYQREEQQQLLRELLETPGWRHVARPGLLQQRAALMEKIAADQRLTPEQWRIFQQRCAILREMLDDPISFFLPGESPEPE